MTVDKAAITRELDVVREANAIVEREVHVERGAAAEAIVADRKAEHDRLRRAIVDTACALAEAISTEVEFVDRTSGEIGPQCALVVQGNQIRAHAAAGRRLPGRWRTADPQVPTR